MGVKGTVDERTEASAPRGRRLPPIVVDVLMVAVLLGLGLVAQLVVPGAAIDAASGRHAAVIAGAVLPLLVRRRHPMAALTVIAVVTGVSGSIGEPLAYTTGTAGYFAMLVALYTTVSRCPARTAAVAGALTLAAMVLVLRPWVLPIAAWAPNLPAMVAAFAGGRVQRRRAALAQVLAARLGLVETQRERLRLLAVERARGALSRDLQESVAALLDRMTMQAEEARRALASSSAQAMVALARVGTEGRTAVADLRRMLELLRGDAAAAAAGLESPAPPPRALLDRAPTVVRRLARMAWPLDLVLVVAVSTTTLLEFPTHSLIPGMSAPAAAFSGAAHCYAVGWVALLLLRRRWPVATAVAMSAMAFVQSFPLLYFTPNSDIFALQLAVFTVGQRRPRSAWRWIVVVLGAAGIVSVQPLTLGFLAFLLICAITLAGAAHIGRVTGETRLLAARLQDDLRAVEEAHRTAVELVLRQERLALARDMHDLVAHSLSLMVVQAEAARAVANSDPAAAMRAATTVIEAGSRARQELDELLSLLDVDGGGVRPIAPTSADIEALVAQARAGGVDIELRSLGERRSGGASVDLSVYRIVQEALTNARKHAPGARVAVEVRYDADSVHVRVENHAAEHTLTAHPATTGGGHGLVGMRERVTLFGGRFHAGPRAGGGYAVEARLPLGA